VLSYQDGSRHGNSSQRSVRIWVGFFARARRRLRGSRDVAKLRIIGAKVLAPFPWRSCEEERL